MRLPFRHARGAPWLRLRGDGFKTPARLAAVQIAGEGRPHDARPPSPLRVNPRSITRDAKSALAGLAMRKLLPGSRHWRNCSLSGI